MKITWIFIILIFINLAAYAQPEALQDTSPKLSEVKGLRLEPLVIPKMVYPKNLLKVGNGGRANVKVVINKQGEVTQVVVLESIHPDLEKVVVQNILATKFKPIKEEVEIEIPYDFMLEELSENNGDAPFKISSASNGLPEKFQFDIAPQIKIVVPTVYPLDLLKKNQTGKANVMIIVDPHGRVVESKILSSTQPEFGLSAQASFSSWIFDPAIKDGQPSWAALSREYHFNPRDRDTGVNDSAKKILKYIKNNDARLIDSNQLDSVPLALYSPYPNIPSELIKRKKYNEVLIEFYLDEEGMVQLPKVISPEDDDLTWLLLTQVQRWQFQKPLKDGKPVITKLQLPISIGLSEQ